MATPKKSEKKPSFKERIPIRATKIINFEKGCLEPAAKTVILDSLEYTTDVATRRVEGIGKVLSDLPDTLLGALSNIASVQNEIKAIPTCGVSTLPKPAPAIPPVTPPPPEKPTKKATPPKATVTLKKPKTVEGLKEELGESSEVVKTQLKELEEIEAGLKTKAEKKLFREALAQAGKTMVEPKPEKTALRKIPESEWERLAVHNIEGELIAYDVIDPKTGLAVPEKREWVKSQYEESPRE